VEGDNQGHALTGSTSPAASSSGPTVRVGIVSWNTAELLDACLAALPDALRGIPAEVVVVDNASSDDSVEVAERRRTTVIANTVNLGYAKAMNQALRGSAGSVLIALNPDTVCPPGSLTRLVRALLDGPDDVGLVVPRLVNIDGSEQHSVRTFGSPLSAAAAWFVPRFILKRGPGARLWLDGMAPHSEAQDIDWAIGAVHVIRSEALGNRAAPYDETWFMYVEDVELCWWLKTHGWRRRLEPSAEIVHIGNAAGGQRWGDTRTRVYMRATYEWYARDRGVWAARRWAAVNVVGSLFWAATRFVAGQALNQPSLVEFARQRLVEVPIHWNGLVRPAR
jgi:N-acetylglucosaminyl-diphospho-decaprenol L-rhamnosyltransferase